MPLDLKQGSNQASDNEQIPLSQLAIVGQSQSDIQAEDDSQ